MRESKENSNVGGSLNSTAKGGKALRAGDNKGDRQFKFVVSFDTSTIPDGAAIESAVLRLTRGGTTGVDPFATHGNLLVDIKQGTFGAAELEISDYEAAPSAAQVASTGNQGSKGAQYVFDLNNAGRANINKTGRTQLRLYFSLDDDDDRLNDYAGFYPSDANNSLRHPKLIVTYRE